MRSFVYACMYRPLDSFLVSPSPFDLGVTMTTALPMVQAYLLYWVGAARPHCRRQQQMASMTACSAHPSQTKKKLMLPSYSLGLFLPSRNGHGLVALATFQVESNLGRLDPS